MDVSLSQQTCCTCKLTWWITAAHNQRLFESKESLNIKDFREALEVFFLTPCLVIFIALGLMGWAVPAIGNADKGLPRMWADWMEKTASWIRG